MKKILNNPPVIILQHPQEKKKVQTTVDLITEVCENVTVKVGLSWRNLKSVGAAEPIDPKSWIVLYVGTKKNLHTNSEIKSKNYTFLSTKGNPLEKDPLELKNIQGIVLLDGTWKQSKTLWWRNAWLTKLHRVMLIPPSPSLYNKIKKEPRKECLSTLESLALILNIMENENSSSESLIKLLKERLGI